MIVPKPLLALQHSGGSIVLPESTLVIAIDDTGNEKFADPRFPVFGIGGCAVLVRDYQQLIEIPWSYMKRTFFPEVTGPLHAAELGVPPDLQKDALRHFFEKFQFFRVAALMSDSAINTTDFQTVQVLCDALLRCICDVGKHIPFDRCAMIIEESDRLEMDLVRFLSGKLLRGGGVDVPIELFLMPKRASSPLLEVADFIMHTAGSQTRNRNAGSLTFRKDFQAVFQNVDPRLVSFYEITSVSCKPGA